MNNVEFGACGGGGSKKTTKKSSRKSSRKGSRGKSKKRR